jgi:broad specificity phosphatase PhoE
VELVLVRHALPVRIDGSPTGGPADPGLADRGMLQAERVPAALALDQVDAVYSSPAKRSLQTSAPLAAALGLEVIVDAGLAEFDSADTSYVPIEELRTAGDPRWERLSRGELYSDGVDPVEFRARVVAAVERIAAAHPGGEAVLFTHAGVINAYAGHVLGQERSIWFGPAYGSLNRIAAARNGRRSVVSLNETGHIRDLL